MRCRRVGESCAVQSARFELRGAIGVAQALRAPTRRPAPVLKPSLPPMGINKIHIFVNAGFVDLAPLFAASDTVPHFDAMKEAFLSVPADERARVPVQDVMRKLDHGGKKVEWLLQQVVMLTAGMVDGDVVAAVSEGAAAGDPADPVETAPEDLLGTSRQHMHQERVEEAKKERAQESNDFDQSLCLLKLFLVRSLFSSTRGLHAYHYACDAATVGLKDRLLGIISASGRPAAWLPPQVLRAIAGVKGVVLACGRVHFIHVHGSSRT